jgi:hypothetical protein
MHHSGSGRLAIPYPMGDFHLLFFASETGALDSGSRAEMLASRRCGPLFPRQPSSYCIRAEVRSRADTVEKVGLMSASSSLDQFFE